VVSTDNAIELNGVFTPDGREFEELKRSVRVP
jgi:hypothetical protein